MSTRCLIAIKHDNGTFESVYCHFDGYDYDNGVGPTLREFFNSEEQAKALIALGDLSFISQEQNCAYHRDRGDAWDKTKPQTSRSFESLFNLADQTCAGYLYVFEDNAWQTTKL